MPRTRPRPVRIIMTAVRNSARVLGRTLSMSWEHSIFAESAGAAFWQILSLTPMFLGLLGTLGYVCPWFGPGVLEDVQHKILSFAQQALSQKLVNEVIRPTLLAVTANGREAVTSFSFLLSLWAGSSAISAFVDSIVRAHDQTELRHPVRQRIYALILYIVFLLSAMFALPILSVAPHQVTMRLPIETHPLVSSVYNNLYGPGLFVAVALFLAWFYHIALPVPPPWHRLIPGALLAVMFFLAGRSGLLWYLNWVTSTGYTYGALATPIALLLVAFFLGMAVIAGAELNSTVEHFWPTRSKEDLLHKGPVSSAISQATATLGRAVDEVLPNGSRHKDAAPARSSGTTGSDDARTSEAP
ncbi:YihY/virulence factor BrkB family protein [Segniliparus rotundus]|nr:YihY/virulence factor BrkB family protein [Segniliparus rotundus]